ncbi:MAG: hypothetical protein U0P81_06145 [Holophagaceae bacterium]
MKVPHASGIPGFIGLVLEVASPIQAQSNPSLPMKARWEVEIQALLKREYMDWCEERHAHASAETIEFMDLDGDGRPEAIVKGWSCMTGTGGHDIDLILRRDGQGRWHHLPIDTRPRDMQGRDLGDELVGSCNFFLSGDRGSVVQTWEDSSGRSHPLVMRHRWNGSRFMLVASTLKRRVTPS